MKILIIEDEKLLADSIKSMLERKGFQVECVYDGESGKEYAELGIYDLLILDVMMPKMDGFEVARQVRKARCNTPILMLTARSDVADRIVGLNAGADYYLTKPFDSRELLASINALLRRQGGQVNEMVFGNTVLDLSTSTLLCDGKTIDGTVNYQEIYDAVKEEMDKRSKLIENVARRIIDAINDRFPQIKYTELSLSKINPPITGQVGKATVRLISER